MSLNDLFIDDLALRGNNLYRENLIFVSNLLSHEVKTTRKLRGGRIHSLQFPLLVLSLCVSFLAYPFNAFLRHHNYKHNQDYY